MPNPNKAPPPFMTPEPPATREEMKRNPFTTPPPEPPPPAPPELFERIDTTPMWNDFVKFIMKYGNHIISAEYPNPPKSHHNLALTYVDTLWQGVPVANGPRARIRHKLEGWVDWEDCIRE